MDTPPDSQPASDSDADSINELVQAAFRARRVAAGPQSSVYESLSGLEATQIRVRLAGRPVSPDADEPGTDATGRPPEPDEHGRYKIVGEVGHGAIGVVLRACDTELGRDVAMKLLRTDRVHNVRALRRFLEEAQIGGQLEHPGIVPVYDVGLTGDERPFFTMKLVEGRTLREVFQMVRDGEDGWTTTRALGALQRVCDTVAYAHERGVIHRDLKPENVLVGVHGEVYVTDWGLARVLGRDGEGAPLAEHEEEAESSLGTRAGDVLGTPAYMPPEQAEGRHEELGTKADVYALGATLYHLLAGHPPYMPSESKASSQEVWRAVRTGPPQPLHRVAPAAPVELVAVCEKAMARTPAARHGDVRELGEDLRAFLEQRVVPAYRTGRFAELNKWAARNRGLAVALLAILLLALGATTGFGLLQTANARRERELGVQLQQEKQALLLARNDAVESQRAAEEDAERSRQERAAADRVAAFLTDVFGAANPWENEGVEVPARELLDRAVERIDTELEDDPIVRARLLFAMGEAYAGLALFTSAEQLLREAHALRARELGDDNLETAFALFKLATVVRHTGRLEEAEQLFRDVHANMERTLGPEHRHTQAALKQVGWIARLRGRLDEAEAILQECLEVAHRLYGDDRQIVASTKYYLARTYMDMGRGDEFEPMFLEALESWPSGDENNPERLFALHELASLRVNQRNYAEAEELFRECLEGRRRVLGENHDDTLGTEAMLALVLLWTDRPAEAETLYRRVIDTMRARYGEGHRLVLNASTGLADSLQSQGRLEDAIEVISRTQQRKTEVLGPTHPDTLSSLATMGHILWRLGRFDEAALRFQECLDGMKKVFVPAHPGRLVILHNLARVNFDRGQFEAAEPFVLEAIELMGEDHPDHAKGVKLLEEIRAGLADRRDGVQR